MLFADVLLTDGVIALGSTLLGILAGALVVQWRMILLLHSDRITELLRERDKRDRLILRLTSCRNARCVCADRAADQSGRGDSNDEREENGGHL